MADSTGFDRHSGRPLTDWAHVQQSIEVILTTPLGSRVMRRDFGSELYDLVDRKMTSRLVLALYAASAVAIRRWEPRFRLTRASVIQATATGSIGLALYGVYYPRGHLGDYTIAEDVTARIFVEGSTAS